MKAGRVAWVQHMQSTIPAGGVEGPDRKKILNNPMPT